MRPELEESEKPKIRLNAAIDDAPTSWVRRHSALLIPVAYLVSNLATILAPSTKQNPGPCGTGVLLTLVSGTRSQHWLRLVRAFLNAR